ncbi:MAG: class I SAM-dependent methyltransferase [Acidimicrobiia bacterium]
MEQATTACLRHPSGEPLRVDAGRWLAPLAPVDYRVLSRAHPPVLDIGCGPGRHVVALAEQRKLTLGIDLTPPAIDLARDRGAPVLHRSVFARVPGARRWRTALLLDGNIGIGGDPVELLHRVRALLRVGGCVLVELDPPGAPRVRTTARLELGSRYGPWFPWSCLSIDELGATAIASDLTVDEVWCDEGRWFAALHTRARGLRRAP